MPRQIRDVRLQSREARQKLEPAKEPYWRELRRGLHVGYYKGHETGTWWLREIHIGRAHRVSEQAVADCIALLERESAQERPARRTAPWG